MTQPPSACDPAKWLDMALHQMGDEQEAYWNAQWIRDHVESPESVLQEAEAATDAIIETSLKLAVGAHFPADFLKAQKEAESVHEETRRFWLLREAMFQLSAEELTPWAGNAKAMERLIEEKAAELEAAGYAVGRGAQTAPESADRGPHVPEVEHPPTLREGAEMYGRELALLAHLSEDELRRVAGNRKAFYELVREKYAPSLTMAVVRGEKRQVPVSAFPLVTGQPREEMKQKVVWEQLYIKLAEARVGDLPQARERLWDLSQLVVQAGPGTAARQFLALVSRCYIWGFDPATVILCRSVLDAAFREAVSDRLCEKRYAKRRRRSGSEKDDFGLAKRIKTACKEKLISRETEDAAFRVKCRGVKAVHYEPHATKDVLGTIRDTLQVLRELVP